MNRNMRGFRKPRGNPENPFPLIALAPAFLAVLTGAGAAAGSVLASQFLSKKAAPGSITAAASASTVNKNPKNRDDFIKEQDAYMVEVEGREPWSDVHHPFSSDLHKGFFMLKKHEPITYDQLYHYRNNNPRVRRMNLHDWKENQNPIRIDSTISDEMVMEVDKRNRSKTVIWVGGGMLVLGYFWGSFCAALRYRHIIKHLCEECYCGLQFTDAEVQAALARQNK